MDIFIYILIAFSVFVSLIRSVLTSNFANGGNKDNTNLFLFNGIGALFSIVILFIWSWSDLNSLSIFTFLVALFFGLILFLSQFSYLKALENGEMSLSTMFFSCGMVIPTIFGMIVSKEIVTAHKVIGISLMVIALILNSGVKKIINLVLNG